jgi:hypothetical protein
MDGAWISALSGMVGTVVGLSSTVATTWITQRTHDRNEVARERLQKNETLYGEFIDHCSRLLVDACQHQLQKAETMLPAYALINRIRLCASTEVLNAAEHLVGQITDQYFAPNLSVDEVRELARSPEADPLRTFGQTCRDELLMTRQQF